MPGAATAMTAAATRSAYKQGEQVVITVTLANHGSTSCHLPGAPDGVVTIGSMTRDGVPVTPVLSEGDYVNGFTALIAANAVVVDPKKATTVTLASTAGAGASARAALPSSTLTTNDRAAFARWPVGQPGAYVVSLSYRMPPIQLPMPPACQIPAARVSVSFTISGT
jgi:hypothetical protein